MIIQVYLFFFACFWLNNLHSIVDRASSSNPKKVKLLQRTSVTVTVMGFRKSVTVANCHYSLGRQVWDFVGLS